MNINRFVKIILIGCAILALSSCATRHRNGNGYYSQPSVSDADLNGAEVSGAGGPDNFGANGGSPCDLLHKRTYYFDFDRSDVRAEDRPAICANANYLASHPNQRVRVEGHTDPRGSREYNVALAERRANAVAEILRAKGVNSCRMRVVSYGAERLACPGHSEEAYQLDRRAVIDYQK